MTRPLDVVAFLMRWKRDQQPDYAITITDQGIGVLASPCSCCSIAVEVDFPLDADFVPTLESLLDAEWRRSHANCICRDTPYTIDVRGMGRDEPEWHACVLECCVCDEHGPNNTLSASEQGWTAVERIGDEDRGESRSTHNGWCPACAAQLDAQDRADLGIDAASDKE